MDTERPFLFVLGAGGHAKVVIDILEREGRYRIGFVGDDDPIKTGKPFFGYPVVGDRHALARTAREQGIQRAIVALGHNTARLEAARWLQEQGFELVRAIHPSAQIGRGASIGAGTSLMAGAIVNPDTSIGEAVVVNTAASVDHDCEIGDGAHLAPGSRLCGGVRVGRSGFVGSGAVVLPNVQLGAWARVGAGATVTRNVDEAATVVGTPAGATRHPGRIRTSANPQSRPAA